MQLSYNLPSQWASGVMTPQPSLGLTEQGRAAVAQMNASGVAIDIAHADEKSSPCGVMAASSRPVTVTHAGCKTVYDHPRHKSDALLRKLADQGGVIGIFELSYLNGGVRQPRLEDYMAHMVHALKVCGEDGVRIGSDAIMTAFDTTPREPRRLDTGGQTPQGSGHRRPRRRPAALRRRPRPPRPRRRGVASELRKLRLPRPGDREGAGPEPAPLVQGRLGLGGEPGGMNPG